jgi:hypothetical protein
MDEDRFHLRELLAWAEAPSGVLTWARAHEALNVSLEDAADAMALLELAPSPEAAVWLAAVLTIPLDLIASAVIVAVETEAAAIDDALGAEACALAIDSIAGTENGEGLLAMADRCDARLSEDIAGYRERDPRQKAVVTAAAAACRAAEALGAARVRIAFELEAAAAARVSILGAGSILGPSAKAIVGDRTPPFALARPAMGDKPVAHDLRAGVGLLADALTYLSERDRARVRDLFLDSLVDE